MTPSSASRDIQPLLPVYDGNRQRIEDLGVRIDVELLRVRRRVEPEGNTPVAMMIDRVGGKDLLFDPEVLHAVGGFFLGFRKPQTGFANRVFYGSTHGNLLCLEFTRRKHLV